MRTVSQAFQYVSFAFDLERRRTEQLDVEDWSGRRVEKG